MSRFIDESIYGHHFEFNRCCTKPEMKETQSLFQTLLLTTDYKSQSLSSPCQRFRLLHPSFLSFCFLSPSLLQLSSSLYHSFRLLHISLPQFLSSSSLPTTVSVLSLPTRFSVFSHPPSLTHFLSSP